LIRSLPRGLRSWAKGSRTTEAATELLLRAFVGRLGTIGHAWVESDDAISRWIDWKDIPDNVASLSGGERRLLMLAASIGGGTPVSLGDLITRLDRSTVALVLAALSHAARIQTQHDLRIHLQPGDPEPTHVDDLGLVRPLYSWPQPGPTG
jgi:hypothetical protein